MNSNTNQPPITHEAAVECVRHLRAYLEWLESDYKQRTGFDLRDAERDERWASPISLADSGLDTVAKLIEHRESKPKVMDRLFFLQWENHDDD